MNRDMQGETEANYMNWKTGDRMRILSRGEIGGGHRLTSSKEYLVINVTENGMPTVISDFGNDMTLNIYDCSWVDHVSDEVIN